MLAAAPSYATDITQGTVRAGGFTIIRALRVSPRYAQRAAPCASLEFGNDASHFFSCD